MALLVTGSNEMRTVQIGISMLNNGRGHYTDDRRVVLVIIPSIAIFIAGQQLIRGMFFRRLRLVCYAVLKHSVLATRRRPQN